MCEYLHQWQPAVGVLNQNQVHKIFILTTKTFLKYNIPLYDVFHYCLLIAAKRSFAVAQLVEQDTKTPHVKCVVMCLLGYHFRGHIFQSPAESVPLLAIFFRLLNTPPKITNFQYITFPHQQIFRFEVSVDKSMFVQKVNARNCLDKKVKSLILTQRFLPVSDEKKQVALLDVL